MSLLGTTFIIHYPYPNKWIHMRTRVNGLLPFFHMVNISQPQYLERLINPIPETKQDTYYHNKPKIRQRELTTKVDGHG